MLTQRCKAGKTELKSSDGLVLAPVWPFVWNVMGQSYKGRSKSHPISCCPYKFLIISMIGTKNLRPAIQLIQLFIGHFKLKLVGVHFDVSIPNEGINIICSIES